MHYAHSWRVMNTYLKLRFGFSSIATTLVAILATLCVKDEVHALTNALSLSKPQLSLNAPCSEYFRSGRQIRAFTGIMRCELSAEGFAAVLGSAPTLHLKIIRKVKGGHRDNASVRVTQRIVPLLPTSYQKLSTLITLHGARGNARHHFRLKRESEITIPENCDTIADAIAEKILSARACTNDSDCGQALRGFGCGCSNDLVARKNADTTGIYALLALAEEYSCAPSQPITTCECIPATDSVCTRGYCEWDSRVHTFE